MLFLYRAVDVSDWLKELGYDYKSLIPTVSYSGLVGAAGRHQLTDVDEAVSSGVPVTSAFRCAYDGNMARFSHLSSVFASLVTTARTGVPAAGVASSPYLFGGGVLLSVAGGDDGDDDDAVGEKVTVTVVESAGESLSTLATTLLNGSTVVGPRLTTAHGRDVLHFVRDDFDDIVEDVRRLQLRPADLGAGLNVTVHRVGHETAHSPPAQSSSSSSSSVRYVDVRLHGAHATLSVRCGAPAASERARLRHRARLRAVDAAWALERELVRAGKLTANSWTRTQAEQLLSAGRVDGYAGVYLRDADEHPRLLDCPRNIRFVPAT